MSDTFSKVEVITGVARRRRFSIDLKLAVVAETMQPGMSISYVARRHGLSPSLVFRWRRLMSEGGRKPCEPTMRSWRLPWGLWVRYVHTMLTLAALPLKCGRPVAGACNASIARLIRSQTLPFRVAVVEHPVNHPSRLDNRIGAVALDQQIGRPVDVQVGDHATYALP
jgi:transposase